MILNSKAIWSLLALWGSIDCIMGCILKSCLHPGPLFINSYCMCEILSSVDYMERRVTTSGGTSKEIILHHHFRRMLCKF